VSRISSFVSGGRMIRNACGMTIETIARGCDMPSERAASICPLGTAWIPARNVSAMYAAATRPRAIVIVPSTPPGTSVLSATGIP
jgi:hypothetical protein